MPWWGFLCVGIVLGTCFGLMLFSLLAANRLSEDRDSRALVEALEESNDLLAAELATCTAERDAAAAELLRQKRERQYRAFTAEED